MKPLSFIEIVGPPGAGKTTLARELKNRYHQLHLIHPPDWRLLRYFPFYVKNSLSMAPAFASLTFGKQGRLLNLKELFWMICLNGWHRQLTRQGPDKGITIMDQGPIYMMFGMISYREGQIKRPFFRKWWEKILKNWRFVLGGIIWLDASNSVLAQRINTRGHNHIIKGSSLSRTNDFLEQSRVVLNQVISMLRTDCGTPEVISFDTGRETPNEIVDELSKELKLNER